MTSPAKGARAKPLRPAKTVARPSRLNFTFDAALFRELGERLVGKPHIALAELIKNAYDADATEVRVRFTNDEIEVTDNGNGMTPGEFQSRWMRVGSPHKQGERTSPRFHRPVTGSKGIGRLAVQFLASELELRSTAHHPGSCEIRAWIDWAEAAGAGEATRATARYEEAARPGEYAGGDHHGTSIVLRNLQHRWETDELEALAREIWWLQPPFLGDPHLTPEGQHAFRVGLEHVAHGAARRFDEQMRAVIDLWQARLVGRLSRPPGRGTRAGRVSLTLEFRDGERDETSYEIENCAIAAADFEIRVYALASRQRSGVKVKHAREYFREFGGVHVYDGGFHLPYYGPDTDWLRIEIDHSHRLSRSKLLPRELQVASGMNNLPTQSRLFGVVRIDTSAEHAGARAAHRRDFLTIQVSRDRLVDNLAFDQLRDATRWALDYYAMQETRRKLREAERRRPPEPARDTVARVERTLEQNRERIPRTVYNRLRTGVAEAARATAAEVEASKRRAGLLGALATAGSSALAYSRVMRDQFAALTSLADRLDAAARRADREVRDELASSAADLRAWIERMDEARALFSYVADDQHREQRMRFRARPLIEDVRDHMELLLAGVSIDASGVAARLRLPEGTHAEWSAVLQNVFTNAVNAVRNAGAREVVVSSRTQVGVCAILVQDTGVGVDLRDGELLFDRFAAVDRATDDRRGAGLGLGIVRTIANNLGCRVAFVRPDAGFSTAFELSWSETE